MPTLVRVSPQTAGLAPVMETAVGEVMEAMAFLEAFQGVPVDFSPGEPVYCTRLPVYRPEPAVVGMAVPQGLAVTIAGTMMGCTLDPCEDGMLVLDALGELTNMLAGSLLTLLLPAADGFELGLPECRIVSDMATEPAAPGTSTYQFTAAGATFLTSWQGAGDRR
jgi:hypothetical protein